MADASKPDSMYAVAADGSLVTLAMNPADRNAWLEIEQVEKPRIGAPVWGG